MGLVFGESQAISGGVDMRNRILALTVVLFSGGVCLAACPSADLNGDCLVNFLDFHLMALQGNLLDLHTMASQWLDSGENDAEGGMLTLLGRVDIQMGEPNSFAVELAVVDKRRVDRSVFEYECEVILTNLSPTTFENVQLVMVNCPDNMTIIDPHVSFGDAQIGPGESAASIDTCTFTVDRSEPINPVEIIWRYVTASQDMVFVPGGTFQMGDTFDEGWYDERPVHTVTLDSVFMARYELTNGQYCQYLNSALDQGLITVTDGVVYKAGSGASYPYCDTSTSSLYSQISYSGRTFGVRRKGRSMVNDPMVDVSWYGAAAYCNWRSQQEATEICYNTSEPNWPCDFTKKGYRLPTEAEWEYAARGYLSGRRFPWGDTISHSQANYYSLWVSGHPYYPYDVNPAAGYHPTWDNVYPYTSPVGSFAPNGYGLYDVAGNVNEWCNDLFDSDYYDYCPVDNPTGPTGGRSRVLRGGGWYNGAGHSRCAFRRRIGQGYGDNDLGFRLVLDFQ